MEKGPPATLESVERLRSTVRGNPRSTAFVVLSHQLSELGRAAEAEDVARRGLEQHPGLPTGEVALARALAERGKLREAQGVLVGTVKDHPQHADAFRWLGEILVRRGDFDRAKAILQHALELAPTDERAIDLVRELGGDLPAGVPRPKTDFEATRIADGEAIARRLEGKNDEPTVIRPMDDLIAEAQPTVIRQAPAAPGGRPRLPTPAEGPTSVEVADQEMASGMEAILEMLPQPVLDAARPPVDDDSVTPPIEVRPRRATAEAAPVSRTPSTAMPAASVAERAVPMLGGTAQSARYRAALGRRRVAQIVALAGVGVLLAGGIAQGVLRYRARERSWALRRQMTQEIALGSLTSLLRARESGIRLLAAGLDEGNVAADLAFVSALLAREYALAADEEAERAIGRAVAADGPTPARAGTIDAARALVALGGGKLGEAVDRAVRASGTAPRNPYVQTALGRARFAVGDLDAARTALEDALSSAAGFGPAATALGEVLLEQGEAGLASAHLQKVVGRSPDHVRARLLLGEARRAQGGTPPSADPALQAGCREDGALSPAIAAACALGAAEDARIGGQRARALELVRTAVAAAPPEPRVLAATSQLLAQLGQQQASADLAERSARYASDAMPAVAWARLGVVLGTGIGSSAVPLARPATPETRLLAVRAADVDGRPGELAASLAGYGREAIARDPDLRAFAIFSGVLPRPAGAGTARNLSSGPLGAFLAGRLARRERETDNALAALSQALDGHGDACRAAAEYRGALADARRDPLTDPAFRAFLERKLTCANFGGPAGGGVAPAAAVGGAALPRAASAASAAALTRPTPAR